ncbi:MAG: SGNH/GDSL hydrolase family protein [Acidobacteriota bacterium]
MKIIKDYKLWRKLFNIFGIVLLSLIVLELILRLLGFIFLLKFDNRTDPENLKKKEFNIICIGDSWTIGNWKENYPRFLNEKLKKRSFPEKVNVVNLGIAGSNSTMASKKITKNLPVYNPDLIILMTGNNDHWNLTESTYWLFDDKKLNRFDILKAKMRVSLHSLRTYKFFVMIYRKIAGIQATNEFFYLKNLKEQKIKQVTTLDRKIFKKQLYFNLIKIIELSKERGFDLILMTYFHFHGFHVNEYIRDIATRFGIPLVDNNFLFHKKIDSEKYRDYLIPDGHPNGKGYDFIADHIVEVIIKSGIIKERSH